MNAKGEMTLKEMIGIFIFIIAFVAVFAPPTYATWKTFTGKSEDNYAESTLEEIFEKADYMVGGDISMNTQILLNKPQEWFLVGAGNKLCICNDLAGKSQNQEIVCKDEGGICEEFKYGFEIATQQTGKLLQEGLYPGRQQAIRFLGYNKLVIQKDSNNFFTFRKSIAETNLNFVLEEFLDSNVLAKDKTIEEILTENCENRKIEKEIFENQVNDFFKPKILNDNVIRFEFQAVIDSIVPIFIDDLRGETNYGLVSPFYSYIYPEGEKFEGSISDSNPEKFQKTLPATYKILNGDCVIYLTSTTDDFKNEE